MVPRNHSGLTRNNWLATHLLYVYERSNETHLGRKLKRVISKGEIEMPKHKGKIK